MNNSQRISKSFIAELGNQELWATIHNCAPLVQASGWTSKKYYEKFSKNSLSFPAFVSIKDDVGVMYIPITKTKKQAEEALEAYLADSKYMQNLSAKRYEYESDIRDLYAKMTDEYLDKTSEKELEKLLAKLRDTVWEYNALVFFSTGFDLDTVNSVAGRHGIKVTDEFWNLAGKPPTPSFERRHGWYVAENSNTKPKKLAEQCQYFFAAYNHVPMSDEVTSLLEKNYGRYMKMGTDVANAERKELIEARKKHDDWVASLSKDESQLAKFVESVIEMRDERKDYLLMMTTLSFRAAWSVLRKSDIPTSFAGYLNYDELMKGEQYIREHSKEIINRRNGFDVYCRYDGSCEVEYGHTEENCSHIENMRMNSLSNTREGDDIVGQIGYKGKVVGKIRKVLNLGTDANKFEEGEILVAGMTRPEYVPLMKKASAIITDEGGITCHAAIVSRELRIPCIIGTKVATKVLKDGDMVEVDADKGIVKIIKS